MKKLFLTLVAVLCFTAMVKAANGKCINGIYYNLYEEGKTATVTWGGKFNTSGTAEYKDNIIIPASVESDGVDYAVTSIGEYAFCNCTDLISITLPEGVTRIVSYSFSGCTNLSSVSFPTTLKLIFSNAFDNCQGLTSISLPEGLEEIFTSAFTNCKNLTSVTIPSSVTRIGDMAFYGATGLKEVLIYTDLLTTSSSLLWDKSIPTYVTANSYIRYKSYIFMDYNLKVLPDDDNIGELLKSLINLSDEETEIYNELLKVRNSMGKPQPGPAIEIEGENGKTLKLYNVKNVKFTKEEE